MSTLRYVGHKKKRLEEYNTARVSAGLKPFKALDEVPNADHASHKPEHPAEKHLRLQALLAQCHKRRSTDEHINTK